MLRIRFRAHLGRTLRRFDHRGGAGRSGAERQRSHLLRVRQSTGAARPGPSALRSQQLPAPALPLPPARPPLGEAALGQSGGQTVKLAELTFLSFAAKIWRFSTFCKMHSKALSKTNKSVQMKQVRDQGLNCLTPLKTEG